MITISINLLLYTTALLLLLYIGKMKPTWRGELSGIEIAIFVRVLFYITSVLGCCDAIPMHGEVTHFLSVLSSMFAGVVMVGYSGWFAYKLRGDDGI